MREPALDLNGIILSPQKELGRAKLDLLEARLLGAA
jgi:hypothetical protein